LSGLAVQAGERADPLGGIEAEIVVAPPMPPFELKTIMPTKVVVVEPVRWRTTRMIAGTDRAFPAHGSSTI